MDLDDLKHTASLKREERYGYVYHTTFRRPTDHKLFHYVGQHAVSSLDRKYIGSGHRLRKFINKYGRKGNFRLTRLSWAKSLEELNSQEVYFIEKARDIYGSACINLTSGGNHGKHSEETKRLLSELQMGKPRRGDPKNWKHTDRAKAKMSLSHSDKTLSVEHRKNIGISVRASLGSVDLMSRGQAISLGHSESPKVQAYNSRRRAELQVKLDKKERLKKRREWVASIRKLIFADLKALIRETREDPRIGVERPKEKCPHCERLVSVGNSRRWHFSNCKYA